MAVTKATLDPVRFAQCRSNGHEWHHNPPVGSDENDTSFRAPFAGQVRMVGIHSVCASCRSERMRWVTSHGESIMRYSHPEGYEQHGEDRLSPLEWRRTYVAGVFESFERRKR